MNQCLHPILIVWIIGSDLSENIALFFRGLKYNVNIFFIESMEYISSVVSDQFQRLIWNFEEKYPKIIGGSHY